MIAWGRIKAATKPLIADLSGLPLVQVRWQDEPEGSSWVDAPVILLRLKDEDGIGIEEERRATAEELEVDPSLADEVVVCAQKRFTLGIRCESFVDDIADPRHAGVILSAVKTRLARTSTVERLHGIFGIETIQKTVRTGYTDDSGRALSVYIMDLWCLTVDNDVDTADGSNDVIEEVIVIGEVTDGETVLPVNLDVKP